MQADTLLTGGCVITMDPASRVIGAGAVAVQEGKIVAIGSAAELTEQVEATEVIDCTGHVVFPGLVDVHA
ncbi:MAG TPA: amidohydrolase, partial [Sulfitobacter sp.]|nr:amidohydrolase [Sulfitobacter sp.]